jgi:argininosuccinate lyase
MSLPGKDPALSAIHVSIGFDKRLWREDIEGSLAHVKMLAKCNIISADESEKIQQGLHHISKEIEAGTFPFREEYEDIHLNIEKRLTELIGEVGGKLHTGRSRNDQVATDFRLWIGGSGHWPIKQGVYALAHALLTAADREWEAGTVLPFYTHLQRAQPVLLAHHLLAHTEALWRDLCRLSNNVGIDDCPLGAGAGAGSGFPIDPQATVELLHPFREPCRNSLDAVAARDFALEYLSTLSILMTHLSRLAEELILWSSAEFGFIKLSDKVTTGSSIMPQKRNPDGAELVRGKTGRVFGHLMALLTTVKALPLAYNKDLQEDKEAVFDAFDTVKLSLDVLTACIREATFDRARMRAALEQREGYANATELADYLARKGMPFREAHGAVRRLVGLADAEKKRLEEMPLELIRATCGPLVEDDVYSALTIEAALARRSAIGGTAPARVREALARATKLWSDDPRFGPGIP